MAFIRSLAILEREKLNPFAATFQLAVLKDGAPVWWLVVSEVILAAAVVLTGRYIYKYGRDRQIRNNNFFFELFQKYRGVIVAQLKVSVSGEESRA